MEKNKKMTVVFDELCDAEYVFCVLKNRGEDECNRRLRNVWTVEADERVWLMATDKTSIAACDVSGYKIPAGRAFKVLNAPEFKTDGLILELEFAPECDEFARDLGEYFKKGLDYRKGRMCKVDNLQANYQIAIMANFDCAAFGFNVLKACPMGNGWRIYHNPEDKFSLLFEDQFKEFYVFAMGMRGPAKEEAQDLLMGSSLLRTIMNSAAGEKDDD